MLIDHIGAALVGTWLQIIADPNLYHQVYVFYRVLRGIGRLAFPLYIFLLVEGFFYTHSRKNYLCRLTLFLVLSEIPFDLALKLSEASVMSGRFWTLGYQNVYFTLVIGFVGLLLAEAIEDVLGTGWKRVLLTVLVMFLTMLLANHLNTDYGMAGILAIFAAYFLRDYSKELEMLAIVLVLAALSSVTELYALADILLVYFYHGNRGTLKISKWAFYAFYPVHLLILAGLKILIF